MSSEVSHSQELKDTSNVKQELFRINISLLNATTWCTSCSRRFQNPQYRCRECQRYYLCSQCYEDVGSLHAGHSFELNDLEGRVRLQMEGSHTRATEINANPTSVMTRIVPRNCCPTCFNHRPVMSMLLSSCAENADGSDLRFSYHDIYVSDMKASAERGCPLCSIIYRGMILAAPELVAKDSRLQWDIFDKQIKISDFKGTFKDTFNYQVYAASSKKSPFGLAPAPKSFHKHFREQSTFARIRHWMSLCKENHTQHQCQCPSKSVLPRRTIVVEGASASPCLRLSENSGELGQYIALSHCWGKEPIFTTKSSTLGFMIQDIPCNQLPATFLDAIYCAQMLDIQNIWIDSLCIIQDDSADWERESARIDSYYANADLVIVAARSSGDKLGFLKERPAKYVGIPLEVEQGSGDFDVLFQHKMPHLNPSGLRSRTEMLNDMTASRAWCMQEIVLARRSVFFHESELVWECQSNSDCECGLARRDRGKHQKDLNDRPFVMRESESSTSFMEPSPFFEYHMKPLSNFANTKNIFEEWKRGIVPMYTAKQLTKATDRLPALSGLASFIAQALGRMNCDNQYLAGLWKEDLQLSLLWSLVDKPHEGGFQWPPPEKAHPMPSTYLGPSFSWVSVDNEVTYILPHVEHGSAYGDVAITLIEASCSVVGLNPFGVVDKGYIKVTGLSQQLAMISTGMPTHPLTIEEDDLWDDAEFMADTYLAEVSFRKPDGTLVQSVNRSAVQQQGEGVSVRIDALLVADIPYQKESRFRRVTHEYAMILLGRVPSPSLSYQRIGLLVVSMSPENAKKWVESTVVREYTIV